MRKVRFRETCLQPCPKETWSFTVLYRVPFNTDTCRQKYFLGIPIVFTVQIIISQIYMYVGMHYIITEFSFLPSFFLSFFLSFCSYSPFLFFFVQSSFLFILCWQSDLILSQFTTEIFLCRYSPGNLVRNKIIWTENSKYSRYFPLQSFPLSLPRKTLSFY
jgi:hypothetical protein